MKKAFLILIFFIMAAIFYGQSARDLYNKAKWELRRGNLYSAIQFFKNALQVNPYYRQCYEGLARVYIRLNNYHEAYKNIIEALKYDSNNVDNLVDMAKIRMKLSRTPGEILAAEQYLQRAYNIEPRNKRVLLAYGDYESERGFYDKAIEFYNKALLVDERDFMTYIKISKVYARKGDRHNSEKYIKLAEELNSRSEVSNYELGVYYYNQSDYDRAEKYFRIAVSIKADYINALNYLVSVYFVKRDWEKANYFLTRLRRLTPRDPLIYYYLGITMSELGASNNDQLMVERAIKILQTGLTNRVSDDMIRLMAEEIAVKKLKIGNAVRNELSENYMKIANEYLRLNLIDRAVLALKRGIRLNPKSVRFRHRLATIYRRLGYIDRFYRELLLIQRDITQNDSRVNDDLMFMRNRIVDNLAYKERIRQYEIDKPRPKIVFTSMIEDKSYRKRHIGISPVIRELLHQSLLLKGRINISELSSPRQSEESILQNQRADIILRGFVSEQEDALTLRVDLITVSTGNVFASFSVTKKGNQRITEAVLDTAERINQIMPVFGRIIRLSNYTAVINVGRMQGYKNGDEFEIYRSPRVVRDVLSGYPIDRTGEALGTMKITEAGEMISRVELSVSRYIVFNSINLNDVIIFKPKIQPQARRQ